MRISEEFYAEHQARMQQWIKNTLPVKSAGVFSNRNISEDSQGVGVAQNSHPLIQGVRESEKHGHNSNLEETAKKSKYRNRKVTIGGIIFDSVREANRWLQLKELQTKGKISDLRRQAVFVLAPSVILDGRKKPAIRYLADFNYFENGKQVVEDVKSPATKGLSTYRLKKHLLMSVHGLEISEI